MVMLHAVSVGLLGYGEVGRILAEDLRAQSVSVRAYDLKLEDASTAQPLQVHAQAHGVQLCASAAAMAAECDVLISAVTASQTLAAAQETFPGIDWQKQASYFFQRVIEHGRRRSEEMFESAHTVSDVGMPAFAAQAIAQRQAWVADLADRGVFGTRATPEFARSSDWRTEADRLLHSLKETSQ